MKLFIHLSSMSDGNDGNNKSSISDLVNDAVVADPDAPARSRKMHSIPIKELLQINSNYVQLRVLRDI
jgi:hypothetical protein